MKYDSNRKTARNKELIEMRKSNPDMSLKEIGQHYGISGARVSQIIRRGK